MRLGTIHALCTDLFVIEGTEAFPMAALYRCGTRLCLLGTGRGAAQRAAIRAVVASYGPVEELVLLGSSACPCPEANDDLLDELPAGRRRHLRPGGAHLLLGARPVVPVEDYANLPGPGWIAIGSRTWPGWELGDLGVDVLRIGPPGRGEVGFYVAACRALVVPALLPDAAPDGDSQLPVEAATEVLGLLDEGVVGTVSGGLGAPLDEASCRRVIGSMIGVAGHPRSTGPVQVQQGE